MLKNILISVVSSIIVVIVAFLVFPDSFNTNFAGVSHLSGLQITDDGLKVGTTTPNFKRFSGGICYIDPYSATITGTTTATVDCQGTLAADASGSSALAGVKNNEPVFAVLSTTTSNVAGTRGITIVGASASSTTGHIELRIANLSAATYTWSTTLGTASGTASYWVPSLNR